MKLTSIQIVLYLIFIICIIFISYYYINTSYINTTKKNNIYKEKEGFTDNKNNNNPLKEEINIELNKLNIKDVNTQKKIFTYITSLQKLLNKYNNLDVAITINNNGQLCDNWGNYSNGAYNASKNSCLNIPGQNEKTCLNNNSLVSCSKYFDDGEIDNLININTNDLVNNSKYNIYLGINNINTNLNKANIDMTTILTDYIAKRNLENQQDYFIKYNEYNLADKKKIIDKTNKEFEKTENNVNINKIQFQQTVEQNNVIENKYNNYYNYIFYTIIGIIIVGILNFMFSNLD
jgi:hypothetical protein